MRLLCLHQYYCPPGGYGNDRSRSLYAHWAAHGLQVHCITSTAYFPQSDSITRAEQRVVDGVSLEVLPVPYGQHFSKARKAWAFIRFAWLALWQGLQHRPQVILASVTPPTVGYIGALLARLHRVPLVLEVVDVWPDVPEDMGIIKNKTLLRLLHALNGWVYRSAAHIVALSPGMREQILRHGVPPHKVTVSYNGTDTLQIQPAAQPAAQPPVRLVYAGALGQANGVPAILPALARLAAELPNGWRLDIYGWGAQRGQLENEIPRLGLQSHVYLHHPVPKEQMAAVLQQAHIGLVLFAPHPVLEANSANKYYDYLAAGLPVLLNYGGWQAQALDEYGCGLWAPMGDAEGWYHALYQLVTAEPLRRHMAQNARRLAEERYDRATLATDYLKLLNDLRIEKS